MSPGEVAILKSLRMALVAKGDADSVEVIDLLLTPSANAKRQKRWRDADKVTVTRNGLQDANVTGKNNGLVDASSASRHDARAALGGKGGSSLDPGSTDPKPEDQQGSQLSTGLPDGPLRADLLRFQRDFLVAAYERAVAASTGQAAWGMTPQHWPSLVKVLDKHCRGEDRKNIEPWLEREVTAFVRAVSVTGDDPGLWSSWGPNGLLRWYNAGRPGHGVTPTRARSEHPLARARPEAPTMTPEETAKAAEAAMAVMNATGGIGRGGGNGR